MTKPRLVVTRAIYSDDRTVMLTIERHTTRAGHASVPVVQEFQVVLRSNGDDLVGLMVHGDGISTNLMRQLPLDYLAGRFLSLPRHMPWRFPQPLHVEDRTNSMKAGDDDPRVRTDS